MNVSLRMSANPITILPTTPVAEAQALMKAEKLHRLPVVDKSGKLVGIVTERDLLYASPSPASTLNVYELSYLLAKLRVEEIMKMAVITIDEGAALEEAAKLMAEKNIGGLPVLRNGQLVGVITESDLFKVFLDMLGVWKSGLRATVKLIDHKGGLAEIAGAVAEKGGNILGVGFFHGETDSLGYLTLKVEGMELSALEAVLKPFIEELVEIKQVEGTR